MTGRIFINYRRDDSSGTAGRLNDRLVQEFGRKNLFMDVDNIPAGVDFVTYLNARVAACDVFLAVIGPNWLDAKDASGRRRLDDPDDYVGVEIAAALQRDIRVIPVLIDGASVPKSDELPQALKPVTRRHAVEVRNAHFGRDAEALAEKIREALNGARSGHRWPAAAAVGVAVVFAGCFGIYQFGLTGWVPTPPQSDFGGIDAIKGAAGSKPPTAAVTDADLKARSVAPTQTQSETTPAVPLADALVARQAAFSIPAAARQINVQNFQGERAHKAFAVSPEARGAYWSANWPTAGQAETAALEGCQIRYGAPCVLIATDDKLTPDTEASRAPRDMPRARYAGTFDLRQIPRARADLLKRADVANYEYAPDPKAAAFQTDVEPGLVTVTAAPSQHDAEEQALAECNKDRKGGDGSCFLYAIGNQVVLPQRLVKPLTQRFYDALLARITAYAVPAAERWAKDFEAQRAHKALAVSPQAHDAFWSANWRSASDAETGALEGCQIRTGNPCALVATDDKITPESERGMRDMPRARYGGTFDLQQIPRARLELLIRSDVINYASAPRPKAAALHPDGIPTFVLVTDASTQFHAEDQALAKCNALPKPSGGPCFLYAIGNQVVLPLRSTKPLTQREIDAAAKPAAAPELSFQEKLVARLVSLSLDASHAGARAREYDNAAGYKAIAVAVKAHGAWRSPLRSSEQEAVAATLEGCQIFYEEPCALAAAGYRIVSEGPRDMPRTRYAGHFEPVQIPAARENVRRRQDVASYRSAAGPKAAAYHPWGQLFVVTGAASQFAAEEKALADCNNDTDRKGRDGPCFIYAIGDQVVLPQRHLMPVQAGPADKK